MSLNDEQRARTKDELLANFRLAGTTPEEVQAHLDFTSQQFDDTINLREQCTPQDVWLLRDHLEKLVQARGGTPAPYSVLTRRARLAAALWFPLRRAPGGEHHP
ncbi:DUF2316 family protein [Streptomyces sp. NPDC052164]|uniref:DUF2316 family protein n=1 Tax=Streptomyces sp. NPDC052164 TaxID=3155529 RepID=UPI00342A5841